MSGLRFSAIYCALGLIKKHAAGVNAALGFLLKIRRCNPQAAGSVGKTGANIFGDRAYKKLGTLA